MRRMVQSLLALALLTIACDQPAGPPQRGPATLTIHLTDTPGIKAAFVTIAEVYLQGSGGRTVLRSTPYTVDLVTLATTSTVLLEDVPVAAGTYSELRFVVTGAYIAVEDAAGGTQIFATAPDYAALPAGAVVDGALQLPSYAASGLKVLLPDGGLVIPTTGSVSLQVDFDVSRSFGRQAGNSAMWVMHPVITATDVTQGTTLTTTLVLDAGVSLPAGVTLGDFAATLAPASAPGDVLATVPFEDPDGDGTYRAAFGFVTPGAYSVDVVVPSGLSGVTIDPAVPYSYTATAGPGTTLAFTVTAVTAPPPPAPCVLSGTISTNTTIARSQSPCVLQGSVTIPAGVTLALDPGVIIKGAIGPTQLRVDGTLDAPGTAVDPIVFTSLRDDTGGDTNNDGSNSSPAPGDWLGIVVTTGSATLDHAIVRFAGQPTLNPGGVGVMGGTLTLANSQLTRNANANLYVAGGSAVATASEFAAAPFGIQQAGGAVSIDQSTIHDNTAEGIGTSSGSLTVANTDFQHNGQAINVLASIDFTHANNTASGNTINGIVRSGATLGDRTWTRDGMPYVLLLPSLTVSAATTLTVDPGVIVKGNGPTQLMVAGTLDASGTTADPIVFTSLRDDTGGDTNNDGGASSPAPGNWLGILVTTGSANLDHAIVRFGGLGSNVGGVAVTGGTLTLTNSQLTQNLNANLYVTGGAALAISSEFAAALNGIQQIGGVVGVHQSSIHDNAVFGAMASSGVVMDAIDNYWGDPSGPTSSANPGGTGDAVSGNVQFDPWLAADPLAP